MKDFSLETMHRFHLIWPIMPLCVGLSLKISNKIQKKFVAVMWQCDKVQEAWLLQGTVNKYQYSMADKNILQKLVIRNLYLVIKILFL